MAARKTSEKPTRVWKFCARLDTESEQLVRDITWRANRYYNDLVAIQRKRSDRFSEIRRRHAPVLADLEDRIAATDDAIEAIIAESKRTRAAHWRESGEPARLMPTMAKEQIELLRKQQKALGAEAKEHRAAFKALTEPANAEKKRRSTERANGGGPRTKSVANHDVLAEMMVEEWPDAWKEIAASESDAHALTLAARAKCGLATGTYLQTEEAVQRAIKDSLPRAPFFHRHDGEGKIAVQLRGLTYADLLAGTPACSIGPQPGMRALWVTMDQSVPRGEKRKLRMSVKFHRDPPPDAEVKWASLVVRRVGSRMVYEFQLTLEHESFAQPKRPAGLRAPEHVQIGWARVNGGVRVAHWPGSEVVVPHAILDQHEHAANIKSSRDIHRDRALIVLRRWARTAGHRMSAWHRIKSDDRVATLRRQCKDYAAFVLGDRLRDLWVAWKQDRKARGEDLYAPSWLQRRWLAVRGITNQQERGAFWAYCWARKDEHLTQYAVDSTKRFAHRRDAFFRQQAIRIATEFESVTVDSYKIAGLKVLPALTMPGDPPRDQAQHNAQAAAPGRFREILHDVMGHRAVPSERLSDDGKPVGARKAKGAGKQGVADEIIAAMVGDAE
jgi:hypothetical protein